MPAVTPEEQEAELDEIIDRVLVLSDKPEEEDALIMRLQYDLASKIHVPEVMARRYGLAGVDQLKEYLIQHPQVVLGAKKLRALFESDEGVDARIRAKFQFATEECIPLISQLVTNPGTPVAQRIDGFKQLQRGAGVDGIGRDNKNGPLTNGQTFVLNMIFGNERRTITGTTVEHATDIPAPGEPPRLTLTDEEPMPEEDV